MAAHATDAVVARCHEPVGDEHRFHAPVTRAREDRHGHLRRVPRLARDAIGECRLGRGCVPIGVRPVLRAASRKCGRSRKTCRDPDQATHSHGAASLERIEGKAKTRYK